jgi:hypothetical protein
MPRGPQGQKSPADVTSKAAHIPKIATGEIEETSLQQPAKRKNALADPRTRQENATEAQRDEIARKAAIARWK